MAESLSNVSEKAGFPPGSLVHVGDAHESVTRMSVIDYSRESVEELDIQSIDEILKYKDSDSVTWVNIEGLANVDIVQHVGAMFDIHQLVLENLCFYVQGEKGRSFCIGTATDQNQQGPFKKSGVGLPHICGTGYYC